MRKDSWACRSLQDLIQAAYVIGFAATFHRLLLFWLIRRRTHTRRALETKAARRVIGFRSPHPLCLIRHPYQYLANRSWAHLTSLSM